jgi:2,4-didehydro-3-deoxy-L-rhamnonate hydrolase
MKLAVIDHQGKDRVGLLVSDDKEIALLPEEMGDLVAIIEGGKEQLEKARRAADKGPRVALEGARLLPPIRRFRRDVLATGWNYWDHFEEGKGKRGGEDQPRPEHPAFFTKSPTAVIGPYDDLALDPALSQMWDYEAELALVIGKQGRSIPEERAMEHVFGYCLANDVSPRNIQRAHGGQWTKGKSIDATMPLGPWVVTADALDPFDIQIQSELSGEIMQDASTKLMAFPLPTLIAELSWGMTLYPGDVLITGTPAGVGYARNPPRFLQEGDVLVTRASGIGELRNRVVRANLTSPSSG